MSLNEKVTNIIVDKLSVDKSRVVPEASFLDDLGADSLDTVAVSYTHLRAHETS